MNCPYEPDQQQTKEVISMIPVNSEWIAWLDDYGRLRKDAPEHIQEQYKEWKEEWEKIMRGRF